MAVPMQTRTLGRNGPSVSALGLGCMGFSGGYGPVELAQEGESFKGTFEVKNTGPGELDVTRVSVRNSQADPRVPEERALVHRRHRAALEGARPGHPGGGARRGEEDFRLGRRAV